MKAVVTGSTGYIGSCLFRDLRKREIDLATFSIDPPPEEQKKCHVQGDVRDFNAVCKIVRGADQVFHLASAIAITKDKSAHMFDVNVNGAKNVVAACRMHGVKRLIYISSIHAFDQAPRKKVLDETRSYTPTGTLLAYDRSKAEAEMVVKQAAREGLDVVIVNPCGVIGPYDPGTSHMGHVLCKMFQGKMPFLVRGGFNWVDVRDVVDGIQAAAERGRKGENYILGGHFCRIDQLSKIVNRIVGKKGGAVVLPLSVAKMAAPFAVKWNQWQNKPCYFTPYSIEALKANPYIDYQKAEKELMYEARPLETTLQDMYQWLLEMGYVQ